MAKKKTKKSKQFQKSLISKRKKRRLIRLLFVGFAAAASYALYNPDIIKDKPTRNQVTNLRSKLLNANQVGQEKLFTRLADKDKVSQITQHLPQGAILGDEEIQVEEIFSTASEKLQDLPSTSVKKIKTDFCADVIQEALAACTQ